MNKNGKISVVIPTYNRANLLPRAIDSVLRQTRPADEIIVIDDGSTDNTAAVIKPFESIGVRYLRKENGGPSTARNLGIESATGEFIGFLDSDDEWQPEFLSRTLSFLQKYPSAAAAFTDAMLMRGEQLVEPSVNWGPRRKAFGPLLKIDRGGSGCIDRRTFRIANLHICLVIMSAILVRADAFQKTGLFDRRYEVSEDYELWMRMSRYFDFCYVDEPLLISHVHGSNLSVDPKLQEVFRRNNRLALKEELACESDPQMRPIIEDRLRDNWEAEIAARLRQGSLLQLRQTLTNAKADGWRSTSRSMRRIRLVDRCGPWAGLTLGRLLERIRR